MPASLAFRDAGSRDVFMAIARFAGISLIFDSAFRESPVTVDLRNASLDDALTTVTSATRTFFRVTSPQTVVVVPDTPAKRREYEEEIVRTFYLSNADLKETMDLLRLILDARRISPITATNAITIKDTPEHISAAAKVLAAIDKAQARSRHRRRTARDRPDEAARVRPAVRVARVARHQRGRDDRSCRPITLQALKNLSQSDILLTNLPGIYYRLLKTDTNTRALANPQLRTSEGITATARFGDRVPVPVTTFAPIATGGTPQQPITSYQYENVGVNIDIMPRTHHDDDVTLQLNIAITSISGTGFGGLPTFGNREIKTTIRLRDGETSLLAGLIRDNERNILDGIPGLSDLPIVGRLFSHSQRQTEQSDIVLTLTPHIVRVLDLNESDLRPFKVGRESVTPGGPAGAGPSPTVRTRGAPGSSAGSAGAGARADNARPDSPTAVAALRAERRTQNAEVESVVFRFSFAVFRFPFYVFRFTFASRPSRPAPAGAPRAVRSRARRFRAARGGSRRPPPAPPQSAPFPTAGRGCRAAGRAAASAP